MMKKHCTIIVLNNGTMFSIMSADQEAIAPFLSIELEQRDKTERDIAKKMLFSKREFAEFSWELDEALEPIFKEEARTGIVKEEPSKYDTILSKVEDMNIRKMSLLSELDIYFQRALEEKDPEIQEQKKDAVIKKKKFLRDMPSAAEKWLEQFSEEKFLKMNPFGNIFDVETVDQGSGYASQPHVTIDPPSSKDGQTAKAQAFIVDGKLKTVSVVDHGHGYTEIPNLEISPPERQGGVIAKARVLSIENLIEETLKEN